MLNWLKRIWANEPALVAWLVNGGLVTILAFVLHWSRPELAAATLILGAAASAWTAWRAHPPEVSVITGALLVIAGAVGAFGFHPPPHVIALVVAAVSAVIPLLARQNLTPKGRLPKLLEPPGPAVLSWLLPGLGSAQGVRKLPS